MQPAISSVCNLKNAFCYKMVWGERRHLESFFYRDRMVTWHWKSLTGLHFVSALPLDWVLSGSLCFVCISLPTAPRLHNDPPRSFSGGGSVNLVLQFHQRGSLNITWGSSRLRSGRERRRSKMLVVCPASKEQTVLCEIQSKRRKQRGGEFESIFEEMEDFLLKAFFIRPIQGMAPHLVIPVEATV